MKTVNEALARMQDLNLLYRTYKRMSSDITSSLFKDTWLFQECNRLKKEIARIKEHIDNMEYDDSYEQNTGEIHPAYKGVTVYEKKV